jgi:hypothetical protein
MLGKRASLDLDLALATRQPPSTNTLNLNANLTRCIQQKSTGRHTTTPAGGHKNNC